MSLQSWVTCGEEQVGAHLLRHMVPTRTEDLSAGVAWAAGVVPAAYAKPERIARVLERLGKPAAATYLRGKLPTWKNIRSGDLGEIIGAHYATSELGYVTVHRLQWKDHREMAMRGDDIIGVRAPENGPVELLKGEAKSSVSLKTATVKAADRALRSNSGKPSPHALAFIADRLHEQGDHELADLIDDAQLMKPITRRQVEQMLFTFTGNDPRNLLRTNTQAYRGRVRRLAVGLQVRDHQQFIADVYGKADADA